MSIHNTFMMLGASNHAKSEREKNDYYATEPKATELLLEKEVFKGPILEPCCGEGHISEVLKANGYESVTSSDLIDRGYGPQKDFFDYLSWEGDIITNPPYKYALQMVSHALQIIPYGNKVAMFLRLQFLEGIERGEFFKRCPPKAVYVASARLVCAKNAEFYRYTSPACAYCWYVWEKGYNGEPVIRWINTKDNEEES